MGILGLSHPQIWGWKSGVMLLKPAKLRVGWIWLECTCGGTPGRSVVVSWSLVVSVKGMLFPK